MQADIPILTKIRSTGPRSLRARFAGDRREYQLDLTGLLARSKHFAPLMDNAEAFAKVEIVDDGIGVAWPIQTKWGRLDLSGSTLRRIAEEQLPMTGADFSEWRKRLGLSLTEAAKLLGVGRRTIMGYLKKDELPPVVAIACRALARDKHLFAAHYVPARKPARRKARYTNARHERAA
jgi:DNA-binding XRE family transcriptional regulator